MLPHPLHPALVHFPIVLALLMPVVIASAWLVVHRTRRSRVPWAVVVGAAGALFLAAWLSVRTGQRQEDRVEAYVTRGALHEHKEAAERFLLMAGIALVIAPLGMIGGRLGQAGRAATAIASAILAYSVVGVGRSGGHLVYRQGAAQAYTAGATLVSRAGTRPKTRSTLPGGRAGEPWRAAEREGERGARSRPMSGDRRHAGQCAPPAIGRLPAVAHSSISGRIVACNACRLKATMPLRLCTARPTLAGDTCAPRRAEYTGRSTACRVRRRPAEFLNRGPRKGRLLQP